MKQQVSTIGGALVGRHSRKEVGKLEGLDGLSASGCLTLLCSASCPGPRGGCFAGCMHTAWEPTAHFHILACMSKTQTSSEMEQSSSIPPKITIRNASLSSAAT